MGKISLAGSLLALTLGMPLSKTIPAEPKQPSRAIVTDDHPTLATGSALPDFKLPAVDGKTYSPSDFRSAKVLVIAFMCNHCPTSQAYEGRMIQLTNDYKDKGVAVLAINPNSPGSVRLDELGYSDLGDSFDEMKIRARDAGFNFPYLYDGATEATSKKFGPISTPHIFIFDQQRKLRYNGRIDDTEDPKKMPGKQDARMAIDDILGNKEIAAPVTKVFGCSVKWAEKADWIQKAEVKWAHEAVGLKSIGLDSVRELKKNPTDKLRFITVWATWCVPCIQEFPDLVMLNHMYRDRGYQMVSISLDDSSKQSKALAFLEKKQSSSPNYIFAGSDQYKFIEALDSTWQGALPYSMLIEPGGKVVYRKQGMNDIEELKKIIFADSTMGRIYK